MLHPFLTHYQTFDPATGDLQHRPARTGRVERRERQLERLAAVRRSTSRPYAGKQVEVSITSLSDWGFQQFPGVFIDDIDVSTGEGNTSFEDDADPMDGWTVPGAPQDADGIEGPNRNDWVRRGGLGIKEGAAVATDDTLYMGFGFEGITGAATRNADHGPRDRLPPSLTTSRGGGVGASAHAVSWAASDGERRTRLVEARRDSDGRADRHRAAAGGRRRRRPRRRAGRARRAARGARWSESARSSTRLGDAAEPVYGVSTGFGSLADTCIPPERREELQRALIRSHAAGMGPPVEREVVRAMMLLRARTLAMGHSGARPVVVDTMLALLNAGITPVVPEHGSLGASGDLAPLAHCALALIGEGEVRTGRASGPAADALAARHRAAHARRQGGPGADQRHRRHARHAGAGARTTSSALLRARRRRRRDVGRGAARHRPRLRRGPDRAAPAARPGGAARRTCAGCSRARAIVASHRTATIRGAGRLLAALRAAGARRGARHPRATPSASPRPSCARRSTTRWSCPTAGSSRAATSTARRSAFACDFLAIAAAEVGAIAERRTDRLLDPTRSHGLPPFLADDAGRQLGPDDRPVHAGGDGRREPAARRARQRRLAADERDAGGPRLDGLGRGAQAAPVVANLARILAVELVCAARGARAARAAGSRQPATAAALGALRDARVAGPGPRPLAGARARRGRGAGRASGAAARARSSADDRGARSERAHVRCARRAAPSCPAAAGSRRPRCGC